MTRKTLKVNEIYYEDCAKTIERISDETVDLIITSPPYFNGKEYENAFKTKKGYEFYMQMLLYVFKDCYRILKPGGHLWINIDDVHTSLKSSFKKNIVLPTHARLVTSLSQTYDYKEMVLWKKIRAKHATGGYKRLLGSYGRFGSPGSIPIVQEVEYILWFKKQGKRNDINSERRKESALTLDEFKEFGMQIWTIPPERKRDHPAPFPVDLPLRIIKLSTFVHDVVYDPFIGSGTTAIACLSSGRNYIGSELNYEYYSYTLERIEKYKKDNNIVDMKTIFEET